MKCVYQKVIPYERSRVLSQYFDLEHVRYVHPRTVGEARLIRREGNTVLFEQAWPWRVGVRLTSIIQEQFLPPNQIHFRITKGAFRGLRVSTVLHEVGSGTLVEETYEFPLPRWMWIERMVKKWIAKKLDEIWAEDLKVGLPHGGWPGIPSG